MNPLRLAFWAASDMHIGPLLLVLFLAAGCSAEIDFRGPPASPPVIVNYNGVRSGVRRFPDYSAIDRRVLVPKR